MGTLRFQTERADKSAHKWEENMLTDKASRKINILSFILFMGVMFTHTTNLEVYGISQEGFDLLVTIENGVSRIFHSCIHFFFFISGFLFFRNFQIHMLADKYKSRIKSIVIPYIVWNTLYYILFACILKIPVLANIVNGDPTITAGILGYIKYIYDGYYVFWFLRVLMWMYLWTPIWYFLLKKRGYFIAETALTVLLIISLGKTPLPENIVNPYYLLGAYIGINFTGLANKENKPLSILAAICLPFMIFLGKNYSGYFIYICCFFVAVWLALDLFSFKKNVKWWIKCTFFYYCGHDMILETIEKVIFILGGKSYFMAAIDYIVAPLLTLLVLVTGAAFLQKWMRPAWRVLSGGR